MDCHTPGFPVHHQLLELTQTHVHQVCDAMQNHPILCCPLLLLPSIFPSIRDFPMSQFFASGGQSIGVSSFSTSPFSEYSGLISSRMDWSDLLVVQRTLKSLLQHRSSKSSILWCSAFFIVQLSHPYMTTGKTVALSRQTFVSKCCPGWS